MNEREKREIDGKIPFLGHMGPEDMSNGKRLKNSVLVKLSDSMRVNFEIGSCCPKSFSPFSHFLTR